VVPEVTVAETLKEAEEVDSAIPIPIFWNHKTMNGFRNSVNKWPDSRYAVIVVDDWEVNGVDFCDDNLHKNTCALQPRIFSNIFSASFFYIHFQQGLTIDIGNEVREQNSLLDQMGDGFQSTRDMLQGSLARIGIMLETSSGKHMCYMVLFVVFVVIFLYWMMTFKGQSGA
jgi:hypothetical protein